MYIKNVAVKLISKLILYMRDWCTIYERTRTGGCWRVHTNILKVVGLHRKERGDGANGVELAIEDLLKILRILLIRIVKLERTMPSPFCAQVIRIRE